MPEKTIMNTEIRVSVATGVLQDFVEFQRKSSFVIEYGGVLVGYYDVKEKQYCITDITWPQREDIQKHYGFIRKSFGHQEIVDLLWKQSEYRKCYVGEWHTHDQNIPTPSFIDVKNWKKISARNKNYEVSFFIIVGRTQSILWVSDGNKIVKIGTIK